MSLPQKPILMITNPEELQRGQPLPALLRSIRFSGVLVSNVVQRAPWSIDLPQPKDTIIMYMIHSGRCVGRFADADNAMELSEGDVLLSTQPRRQVLGDSLQTTPVALEDMLSDRFGVAGNLEEIWTTLFQDPFIYGGKGNLTELTVLRLFFDHSFPHTLLKGLPDLIRLPNFIGRHRAFVQTTLNQISVQGGLGLLGQNTAIRFAEAVFIKCLMEFLESNATGGAGFSQGMRDPFVSKVIGAILQRPSADWTIDTLAASAGLSRSAFNERFRAVMDMTVMQFVTIVRMAKAAELLGNTELSIAAIAHRTGYGSEAAFSRAFRRWSGSPPGALRQVRPTASD